MASSKSSRLYPATKHFISEEDEKETEGLWTNVKLSQSKTNSLRRAWVELREKSIEAQASLKSARLYPVTNNFISEEDLKETERLLKRSQSESTSLCRAWVEQREKSIENIDCLAKKFDKYYRACNVARGAGTAMEVVGSVAMVAGAILTACGHKSVGEFLTKKVSPATLGTGLATTVSSSVAEIGLNLSTMNEVKMVLKKDEEYTQEFMNNVQLSKKIDSRFKRIFNCSVWSDIFQDVVQLITEGISLLEVGYTEFEKLWVELKRKAQKCNDIPEYTEIVIQNVYTTMKKISADPKARNNVKNICGIIQQSPSTVEFIKLGLRVSLQVCDVLKVDIFANALALGLLKTSAGVMATKGLLGTVLVAVNVLSVISAAPKNAQEESSKYSKMLKDLNLALALELNAVRKNYSEHL